jgi:hypothetical protein
MVGFEILDTKDGKTYQIDFSQIGRFPKKGEVIVISEGVFFVLNIATVITPEKNIVRFLVEKQ